MSIEGKKKVYVGLSGGVDSAVCAALLKEEGYAVTGVFIRTWHPEGFPCTEGEDEREAMRIAAHLDIPFKTLDLSKRYEEEVAKHFIEGYQKGETPNPDVLCNREVKFGGFIAFAKKEGADAVATGHYARLSSEGGETVLLKGVDASKDQSYFLSLVPIAQLEFALFPIGKYKKSEVRSLAQKFKLPNKDRKDSQGICFLGAIDLKQFLSAFIEIYPGKVLSLTGEAIGTHEGAPLYTLGQRHGFSVSKKSENDEALYVQSTDVASNTIVVAPKDALTGSTSFKLREINELSAIKGELDAIVRYHGSSARARAEKVADGIVLHMETPVLAAAGQILALYRGDRLLGAGVLNSAIHTRR